jgi:hypothetical protein
MTTSSPVPPPRPGPFEEFLASRLFRRIGPRLAREPLPSPPEELQPFEERRIARLRGPGTLSALFLPAEGWVRGGVLFLPPWLPWGKTYFYRRGRLEAARAAGYASLVLDLPGFGASAPPVGFYDVDVLAALDALRAEVGDRPLHIWGVSSGGYWAHPVVSGSTCRALGRPPVEVAGAMYEDVSHHLIDWASRMSPRARFLHRLFRVSFRGAQRFFEMRDHAAARGARASAYVSGERDPGVLPADTEALAHAAGGEKLVVPGANHLGAIKLQNLRVIELGLRTFAAGSS